MQVRAMGGQGWRATCEPGGFGSRTNDRIKPETALRFAGSWPAAETESRRDEMMDRLGATPAKGTGILESNRSLVAALDCLPQPAWIFDRSGRYVFQNRIDRETHGDVTGLLPSEAGLGPEEGRDWTAMHLRVIAGERVHYSREMVTSRGRVVSETSIEPIVLDGVIVGGVGVSVDQTERSDAVRRLNDAHQRLQDFVAVSSDWVWETDAAHRFTSVMGDGGRLGVDFSDWLGRTRWEVTGVDPAADPLWRSYADTVERRQPIVNFVFPTTRADGDPMWAEVNGRPRYGPGGSFLGYRGVTRDITRRERLAQQLRRSDIVIQATNNAVVVCDRDGLVQWVNPAFVRLTGYSPQEVAGRRPGDLLECPETDPRTSEEVREAVGAGRAIRTQILNQSRDGRRYWLDVDIRPFHRADGTLEGFVSVQSDVTELIETQTRTRVLVENVAAGIIRHDASGAIVSANPEACRLLGLSEEQMTGRAMADPRWGTIFPDGRPRLGEEMPSSIVLRTGKAIRNEIVGIRLPDGNTRWLRVNAQFVSSPFSEDHEVIASFVDVTQDEEQRRALEDARALLHDIIETIPDAIAAYDRDDRLILFNRAYKDFYTRSTGVIRAGARFEDILRHGVSVGQYAGVGQTPQEQEAWVQERLAIHRDPPSSPSIQFLSDGRWLQVSERRSQSGVIVGARTDITALKQAELAIRRTAETDGLTQLANRSVMMRELDAALLGERVPDRFGAFIIIDLDHFKTVNDTLGHDVGDKLLTTVSRRLLRQVRRSDVVARLGGDEFAVLLTGLGDELSVERMVQKLHKALTARIHLGGRMIRPGISMGITMFPTDGETATDLVKNADIALYQSKARGRNCWTMFNPQLRRRLERRHEIGDALRAAIAADEIAVAFQPLLEITGKHVVGFEVLARWRHRGEAVSPAEFVGIAEDIGLGGLLGRAIMERAFSALARALAEGRDPGHIAINLATSQLKDAQFPQQVAEALDRYGLSSDRLEFEVTENVLLDRAAERVSETLTQLRRMGISLSLDDFGTGYASLTHLKRFPVSRLKIDQSFVRNIGIADDDAAIVRTIVSLAHSLGMTAVAEGVETEEQMRVLESFGCDIAQGYLIGRPSPQLAWAPQTSLS